MKRSVVILIVVWLQASDVMWRWTPQLCVSDLAAFVDGYRDAARGGCGPRVQQHHPKPKIRPVRVAGYWSGFV